MKIFDNGTDSLSMVKHTDGTFDISATGMYAVVKELSPDSLNRIYLQAKRNTTGIDVFIATEVKAFDSEKSMTPEMRKAKLGIALDSAIRFFSEFNFMPSVRFLNTFAHLAKTDIEECKKYAVNYFKLMDSPFAPEVETKFHSPEFDSIIESIVHSYDSTVQVNKRLKIYFGSQGTGKTTKAMEETQKVIVCNASMQPSDLMEDFMFDDGKAVFHPSILAQCMESGEKIVFDEINLLPYDCLRFLQGLCDNKPELQYKGYTIKIKEGFGIIGTMNLAVNGSVFGLPEPLVDRCYEMKEFTLTGSDLANMI